MDWYNEFVGQVRFRNGWLLRSDRLTGELQMVKDGHLIDKVSSLSDLSGVFQHISDDDGIDFGDGILKFVSSEPDFNVCLIQLIFSRFGCYVSIFGGEGVRMDFGPFELRNLVKVWEVLMTSFRHVLSGQYIVNRNFDPLLGGSVEMVHHDIRVSYVRDGETVLYVESDGLDLLIEDYSFSVKESYRMKFCDGVNQLIKMTEEGGPLAFSRPEGGALVVMANRVMSWSILAFTVSSSNFPEPVFWIKVSDSKGGCCSGVADTPSSLWRRLAQFDMEG